MSTDTILVTYKQYFDVVLPREEVCERAGIDVMREEGAHECEIRDAVAEAAKQLAYEKEATSGERVTVIVRDNSTYDELKFHV